MRKEFIILGCGNSTGNPKIDGTWGKCKKGNKKNFRTRCSAMIIKGKNSVLIDTSPDIKYQMIKNNIRDLSSVVYKHDNADQTNGLFELRPFFCKYKKRINVYGNIKTINLLKKRFNYCFQSLSKYPAIVKANIVKNKFTLGNKNEKINFQAMQAKHGYTQTTIYVFENIAYISDCNDLSIVKAKILQNIKFLVIDCLRIKKSPVHFNLEEALFVHNHLNPEKTILTNLHPDLDYDFLRQRLPKNVFPAYDGMKLIL